MAASAALRSPLTAIPVLAPLGSTRRIPVAAACPICPALRIGRSHVSPFGDCTFRRELFPVCHFRIHLKNRSVGYPAFAVPERFGFNHPRFEFRGGTGPKSCVRARADAGVGAMGGSGFLNWAEAVDGGGLKKLLIVVPKTFSARGKRRIQSAPWLTVFIGTMTLAGILASRFALGPVLAAIGVAIVVAAILFGVLVGDGKLRLLCDLFELVKVQPRDQLHNFSELITKGAHDFHRFVVAWLRSIIPSLAGNCKGEKSENLSSRGCYLISKTGEVSFSPICDNSSKTEIMVQDFRPAIEKIILNILSSIAHLISIMTTTELAAGHMDSLGGIKSGIQDRDWELQAPETAAIARQSGLLSKRGQSHLEASHIAPTACLLPSKFVGSREVKELVHSRLAECVGSDDRKEEIVPNLDRSKPGSQQQRTIDLSFSMKCMLVQEASKAPPFHQSITSLSPHREGKEETSQISPSNCVTRPVPAVASDRIMVEEILPSEVVKNVPRTVSIVDSVIGMNKRLNGLGSHTADFRKYSCFTNSLGEEMNSVSKHLSRFKITQGMEAQRTRPRSPDPWQNDCTTGPVEHNARGDGEARSSLRWRNDDWSHVLDLSLIVDDISKAETAREDGMWSGGVNTYGNVDFWGKNAGSSIKTSEQRGTLIKSMAAGRGAGFGSVDDLEDDQPQEQGRRSPENEQRQFVRDELSSSRAGQPWDGQHQAGAFDREAARDDFRKWEDADSAFAADDYGRSEVLIKNGPNVNMGRRPDEVMSQPLRTSSPRRDILNPASVGGRISLHNLVSSRILDKDPSKSLEGEERSSKQSIDGDVKDGSFTGSKRLWDEPLKAEKTAGTDGDPQNGRVTLDSSLAYTQSQPEVIENNVGLQQSKEAQTVKFEKYLDEAEALLKQGMEGLEGRIEVGVAERMLYEAADLLEKASEAYPADLIVVGQWGNTLLVHGQLKLKLSQQLRSMLPSPIPSPALMKREREIADRERESMELTLQEVCEECEELLVDAGRKFRKALSLDKSDVRALYNWALALCYRGQLISEEGGERAMQDADRVYLAAIDKFEAMLGISQDYVPGALLNWGLAMRDRSRLREMGDKERVHLLLQAKELLQDAVHLDPNNGEARGALAVCCAELKELQAFENLQRQDMKEPNRNWRQRRG